MSSGAPSPSSSTSDMTRSRQFPGSSQPDLSFDPTSPSSQLISRPPEPKTEAPVDDDPFMSSPRLPTVPLASSLPSLASPRIRREWAGQSMLLDRGQHTFAGGPNQSFMHLINALSLEDADGQEPTSDEDGDEGKASQAQPLSTLPPIPNDSDEEDESGNISSSREDSEPPSFLSPSVDIPSAQPPVGPASLPAPIRGRQPASKSSIRSKRGPEMSSSIYAIHRPIEVRRRETGETSLEEEIQEDDVEGEETKKARLGKKLADIFGIEVEDVIAEYQCWLFRSVLLQGFLYVTTGHLCFYAYLPRKEGTVLRSERLMARSQRTRRYYKHWFILKDDVLSWYPSSTDPYFPDGHIDLHYCISVEPSASNVNHFKVATAEKRWHFSAESESSRNEWVKLLKKVVFQCQNEGESVKIAIPLETIIDIERSSNLEFAETVRIRVHDVEEGFSIDEYWLSCFANLSASLDQMLGTLKAFRETHPPPTKPPPASGSAASTQTDAKHPMLSKQSSVVATPTAQGGSSWSAALSSRLRLFASTDRASQSVATLTDKDNQGSRTPRTDDSRGSSGSRNRADDAEYEHTYPPEPAAGDPPTDLARHDASKRSSWQVGVPTSISALATSVPEWLRGSSKRLATPVMPVTKVIRRRISEVVSRAALPSQQQGDGLVEARPEEEEEDTEDKDSEDRVNEKFRKTFGLSEKERVGAYFHAYLFRGLPVYGKIYISTSFFCFRSVGLSKSLLPNTKMILPVSDILAASKHRSFRIGYSGLILVIKGHEELFLELQSPERRDSCLQYLEEQIDLVNRQIKEGQPPGDSLEHQEHLALLDLAASRTASDMDAESRPLRESSSSQLPFMFCSTSSDFVTFRPEKSLKFTCLTIGSRGDVQPYIALCKGLMAEGHSCKIASHAEYRGWVEGHGISFEEVGGDPAELMQLMIAHDFFTISFMKEAVARFRGWLDELLETTWSACQGSDVLIESPSAIAGYHIAEALRIPYYRAFTMPWSRTRAYPHAFAVPDHKLGGGYNFMTYTMFDQIFWRATSGQINRWRKKTLGLRSTSLEAMQQPKIPFLYNFSPVVVPPPLDWRENIHVTGYWWLDNPDDSQAQKWQPPSDLLAFLDRAKIEKKKVIFIGFGSIIIPDPAEMTRVVSEAVEQTGVFAIIAKGWSDRAIAKDASAEQRREAVEREEKEAELMKRPGIFNVKSIPHDWLFPRIDGAVHHGGAGTTGASLRAGLPTIIKPFFGDQHFYADRVATLGIGSAVRVMTVENLAAAITTAVTDEKQIARARAAGEAIRKEDGVGKAIECIYRDLEYARSLIPPPPAPRQAPSSSSVPDRGDRDRAAPSSTPQQPLFGRALVSAREADDPEPPRSFPSESSRAGSSDEWDVLSGGSAADRDLWDNLDESRESSVAGRRPASSRGALESEGASSEIGEAPVPG